MTRVALITTTINVPRVLTQWASRGMTKDDIIIIAGDQKSPHAEIEAVLSDIWRDFYVNGMYIHPIAQETRWGALSNAIGWNCIQRRNIALLEAMKFQPEYILTIDDDNFPTSSWQVEQLIERMNGTDDMSKVLSTNTGWYNPGRQCLTDDMRNVIHRGFPLSRWHEKPFYTYDMKRPPVGVAAMLWTGDPDIDAVTRIASRPNVMRVTEDVIVRPGTWGPFNTQATMIRGDLAPAMFMFPHVGRYDDIWASYVYRKVADKRGYGAFYGRPAVHQDRNEHDLVRDLEQEIFGMRYNERVIEIIKSIELTKDESVIGDVLDIFAALSLGNFLPAKTVHAMDCWIADVEKIRG